jgi:hypothetical protein
MKVAGPLFVKDVREGLTSAARFALLSSMANEEVAMFTLKIETGNEAMSVASDVADALHEVARRLMTGDTSDTIRDANGNTVGEYALKDEDE